jgi:hypothetical protein
MILRALKLGIPLLSLGAAGCLSPTPFQPAESDGSNGYVVSRTAQDHFHIGFSGNAVTSREQVQDELAYLAAQVALRNGADYFVVAEEKTSAGSVYHSMGSLGGYPAGYLPCCFRARGITSTEYEAAAEIVIGKGETPPGPHAYDAREVARELAPHIRLGRKGVY